MRFSNMKYKHLFFDLDHTLWDFDANAKVALAELYTFFELENKGVHPFQNFYLHYLHHNEIYGIGTTKVLSPATN